MNAALLFEDFCAAVCERVRFKPDRGEIRTELMDHLTDHMEALLASGADWEEARAAAVAAMGDPVELGRALDRLHSPWPWRVLRFCTAGLSLALVALAVAILVWFLLPEYEKGPPLFSSLTSEEVLEALSREEGETLRTGDVRGGGRVGDYSLAPIGEALLRRIDPWYYEGKLVRPARTVLVFAVSTAHWQPWLGDFQSDWYMLSAVDEGGTRYGTVALHGLESGRLTGRHVLAVYSVPETARQITVTLSTDRGTVRFTVDLEEETP